MCLFELWDRIAQSCQGFERQVSAKASLLQYIGKGSVASWAVESQGSFWLCVPPHVVCIILSPPLLLLGLASRFDLGNWTRWKIISLYFWVSFWLNHWVTAWASVAPWKRRWESVAGIGKGTDNGDHSSFGFSHILNDYMLLLEGFKMLSSCQLRYGGREDSSVCSQAL